MLTKSQDASGLLFKSVGLLSIIESEALNWSLRSGNAYLQNNKQQPTPLDIP